MTTTDIIMQTANYSWYTCTVVLKLISKNEFSWNIYILINDTANYFLQIISTIWRNMCSKKFVNLITNKNCMPQNNFE